MCKRQYSGIHPANYYAYHVCSGMWADACNLQQVGVREAGDEQELVSLSMERALRELDTVITQAFGMQVSPCLPLCWNRGIAPCCAVQLMNP